MVVNIKYVLKRVVSAVLKVILRYWVPWKYQRVCLSASKYPGDGFDLYLAKKLDGGKFDTIAYDS